MFKSVSELEKSVFSVFLDKKIIDRATLQDTCIDTLIYTAEFSPNNALKMYAHRCIRDIAKAQGVTLSSIVDLYLGIGNKTINQIYTVPAINVRALTYDFARIVFRLTKKRNAGPIVFEISRTESAYTHQQPDDFTVAILAAAIKEEYSGPIFLQADHMQFSAENYIKDKKGEIESIKSVVKEFIDAGFYNVDIDASTLVDVKKSTKDEQQYDNYIVTAEMATYIRSIQPKDVQISIGAEIGHIGGINSVPEDLISFMKGFNTVYDSSRIGLSKIAIQTGSSHGGLPLPDGTIAKVAIDFDAIEKIGKLARETYHMGGIVQHGASTLPQELFHVFFEKKALEIHLATGFQNILYDKMPDSIRSEMYTWLNTHHQKEWNDTLSHEQNIYKTRKHAIGLFKESLWNLQVNAKQTIIDGWTKELEFLFTQLHVDNTRNVLK